jgi:hypothetical protein
MRFVKIDNRYINLDRIDEIIVVPPVTKDHLVLEVVLEVRLWKDNDYIVVTGNDAQRLLDALDKMIGDGVYVA